MTAGFRSACLFAVLAVVASSVPVHTEDPPIDFSDDDGDDLSALAEQTWATDPADPDSDDDGLTDGAEVNVHGTDPNAWDTDSGGVGDGDEVHRDRTNPLDLGDDVALGLGMVMDHGSRAAVVFDPETRSVMGSVGVGPGLAVGDCAISAGDRLGFATDFARRVWVVDLSVTPPRLATGTNPIPSL